MMKILVILSFEN